MHTFMKSRWESPLFCHTPFHQENSRRLWRSRRRKSSSVPEGGADLPAAICLAGKCPNLGRDSISRCRKIRESFSSSVESCRKMFPATNLRQPQPSRVFPFQGVLKLSLRVVALLMQGLANGVRQGQLQRLQLARVY